MEINRRLVSVLSGALSFLSVEAFAQDGFSSFIKEDLEDSKKLMQAYITPFMKGANLALNQGWYNTAKTHKMFGLDVTTSISFMTIPKNEMFFNVDDLKLNHFRLADPNNPDDGDPSPDFPNAPTILGPDRTPKFIYTDEDGVNQSFDGPSGVDLKGNIKMAKLPVPMVNLGFSLPLGTDLKIRFAPTVKLGSDGEFKFWGVGVMHDIKQYIPGIKLTPFDLAAFVGYTQMDVEYRETSGNIPGEGKKAVMKMSGTTIQVVISKKFSLLTLYGATGYNIAKSELGIKGKYDIDENGEYTSNEIDPVNLDFTASGPRLTGGLRLQLIKVITLHADYTLQKYNSLNVGFGISVN
jgi:hypothetical protein